MELNERDGVMETVAVPDLEDATAAAERVRDNVGDGVGVREDDSDLDFDADSDWETDAV